MTSGHAGLWESQDTRRARWGGFGPCIRPDDPDCPSCPVMTREYRRLRPGWGPRVPIRIDPDGRPWVMNRLNDGWGERGIPWSWQDLARCLGNGWKLGSDLQRDEHSRYFYVYRT